MENENLFYPWLSGYATYFTLTVFFQGVAGTADLLLGAAVAAGATLLTVAIRRLANRNSI